MGEPTIEWAIHATKRFCYWEILYLTFSYFYKAISHSHFDKDALKQVKNLHFFQIISTREPLGRKQWCWCEWCWATLSSTPVLTLTSSNVRHARGVSRTSALATIHTILIPLSMMLAGFSANSLFMTVACATLNTSLHTIGCDVII